MTVKSDRSATILQTSCCFAMPIPQVLAGVLDGLEASKSSRPDSLRPRAFEDGRLVIANLSLKRNIVHGSGSSTWPVRGVGRSLTSRQSINVRLCEMRLGGKF